MSEWTAEQLAQQISDVGLLDNGQIDSSWSELGSRDVSLGDYISYMLRKQFLTNLQVDRLLRSERYGYFYGKYKILYLVGAGSFARVYRGTNIDTGDVVAVKVLRNRFITDREVQRQFLKEATMVKHLRHSNIVPVYDVGSERHRPYMVMEFIEGQNLRDFLKVRKKMNVGESLSIIEDVINGLEYARSQDISHRDLKLSNVLVTSTKRAKLVDFGLAAISALAKEDASRGSQRSIDYAGLERMTGVRKDDPRSDIYFAGCMLYHLLTGVPPLSETRDRAQRLNVSRFRSVKPMTDHDETIPAAVAKLTGKAMELTAARRFQSPAEMAAQIHNVQRQLKQGEVEQTNLGDVRETEVEQGGKVELEGEHRSVMVVESNIEMQDRLRDLLKRRGYRVLVISNAERAMHRFQLETPAECVIFGTTELGQEAIEAFNRFGEHQKTQSIPAILFLDKSRGELTGAQTSDHRVILPMPLKVRQLRMVLLKLLTDREASNQV
jgi:serine/threonine protein kinase